MEQEPQKPKASLKAKILLLCISLGFCFIFVEILLRIFLPYNLGSTGHWAAPNTERYGWGYNPGAKVRILDPDTGDLHVYKMNDKGWQDRDHEFFKAKDVFRVLAVGDSVTFGAIVAPETIYPRVLEKELRNEGYNVEVISIGYGGWGTDQQLEALKLEGLLYKPDLFINQFTSNDLSDNLFYQQESNRRNKPFSYRLENGKAVRHEDKNYNKADNAQDWFKQQIQKSEILKRIYGVYLSQSMKEVPIPEFEYDQSHIETNRQFFVGENQLRHLEIVMEDLGHEGVAEAFQSTKDKALTREAIISILESADYSGEPETVLRILEKRWFKEFWDPENYSRQNQPSKPQGEQNLSAPWQLYFGIIQHMQETCKKAKVPMAVFCEVDAQSKEWSKYWFMTPDSEDSKGNANSHYQIIKKQGEAMGFDVVPQKRSYFRARNDPHPNAKGHQEMALDLKDFIIEKYGESLPKLKK